MLQGDVIDRVAHLVEHRLRTAQAGDELYSDVTNGPETEDTESWEMTARGDVEVWLHTVYPAMARVPSRLLRTLTREQAQAELVALIRKSDDSLVAYLEKQWGMPK